MSKRYLKNRLKRPSSLTGFTLIELVIAIVIMVIIAALGAITQLSNLNSMKLDAAAQRVASDIRYAQQLVYARAPVTFVSSCGNTQRGLVVDFSIATNSYRIVPIVLQRKSGATCGGLGSNTDVNYIPIQDNTGQPLEISFTTSNDYKGVTISNINYGNAPFCNNTACDFSLAGDIDQVGKPGVGYWLCGFCGNDVIYLGGEFPYAGGTITLSYNGRNKTIRIMPITGLVSIE